MSLGGCLVAALIGGWALMACAAPVAAPASPPPAIEEAAPEWERVVQAARREGKIVIIGPQGSDARDALMLGFQRAYPEIEIDYSGMAGALVAPKLLNELAAGQYRTDLVITGTTTTLEGLRPADALVPVPPYLVGPNSQDRSLWRGGKFSFADDAEELNLVFSAYVKDGFVYNPDLVSPAEFRSYRDLLHPKWKGRIVVRGPTVSGGGLAALTFFYTHPSLGKEFVRQLLSQDIVVSNDDRQVLDWIGRGQQPIAIGVGNTITNEYVERGLPIRLLDGHSLQEGSYLTAGNGAFAVIKNAPHQNALKVYVDWLLSREGQQAWSQASGFASLRHDVPRDHVDPIFVPREGVPYLESHREYYVNLREEVSDFARALLPR